MIYKNTAKDALFVLRERELELAYAVANKEIDSLFENANLDGLDDLNLRSLKATS